MSSTLSSTGAHSSLSSIAVIDAKLPAVTADDSSTSTLSFRHSSPESTLTASSAYETTVVPVTVAAQMTADEHLVVRTRRSSVSSSDFDGTQPSYSHLTPSGIDSIVSTLNLSPCKFFFAHFLTSNFNFIYFVSI